MSKKKYLIFLILIYNTYLYSQSWGNSVSCNENANVQSFWAAGREVVIDATFKMDVEGYCTGTLVNRNTSDGNLGFYFLTARHCMSVDGTNNDNFIDFSQEYTFYFNYQSPDGNTSSTPLSNHGVSNIESYDPNIFPLITDGYEYRHRSKIRLVADYFWGDFALCEMLTPLPPHFNVYFAGWNPSVFYNTQNGTPPPCNLANQYIAVHHPRGDIKKISGANNIQSFETPIATGCYTITTIIDVLFGWIWGHQYSTQTLCNYVDNPWYVVPQWCNGTTEAGSSGSGLFNGSNKLIGTLSGNAGGCNLQSISYGKLRGNYSHASVKNCLNPTNDLWIDLAGMDGRKIDCYDNLILPGVPGVVGEYFPANHYQQENHIELKSSNTIVTNAHLHIYSGADYVFRAGSSITLNSGFVADAGSNFIAEIGSCNKQSQGNSNYISSEILNKLYNADVPANKEFNIDEQKKSSDNTSNIALKIYPNPNSGILTVECYSKEDNSTIRICDVAGKIVYTSVINNNQINELNLEYLENGIYLVQIINKNNSAHYRITITK